MIHRSVVRERLSYGSSLNGQISRLCCKVEDPFAVPVVRCPSRRLPSLCPDGCSRSVISFDSMAVHLCPRSFRISNKHMDAEVEKLGTHL